MVGRGVVVVGGGVVGGGLGLHWTPAASVLSQSWIPHPSNLQFNHTGCLKISEIVSFNIASDASYVYILSGQKFIEKCQKWSDLASFRKPKTCGQTVLPDKSVLIGQKLVENAIIQKFK